MYVSLYTAFVLLYLFCFRLRVDIFHFFAWEEFREFSPDEDVFTAFKFNLMLQVTVTLVTGSS